VRDVASREQGEALAKEGRKFVGISASVKLTRPKSPRRAKRRIFLCAS
jgi:hypothetical protein